MDIHSVTSFRRARTRDDLVLAPGESFLGGGTWLMSEPQPDTTGFVDLTTLPWPEIEISSDRLRIGATCTIARLVAWAQGTALDLPPVPAEWTAATLIPDAANALLASFKIWNTATVGGNICRSFAAGSMTSLAVALDGIAEVWTPLGDARLVPVAALITGNGTNALAPGEVVRAIEMPAGALRSTAFLRKIALAEHGRSGAVVTGRLDPDGSAVFGITAATLRPAVLRFGALPSARALGEAIDRVSGWYGDPLGAADWREAMTRVLAEQIRTDLAHPHPRQEDPR